MGLRFAILLSGRGSNMMSIADLLDDKSLDSDIAIVAADKPCAGLAFASERGFETRLISYAGRAKSDSGSRGRLYLASWFYAGVIS